MRDRANSICVAVAAALLLLGPGVAKADITAEWSSVKPPPAPTLREVTVDPKTTALLVLDLMKQNCGVRPRCTAMVPVVKKLVAEARAHDMLLFYTVVGSNPNPANIVDPAIAPRDGEWSATNGPDKFYGSPLEQRLKDHGIKTVIICGTSAQGAVVGTGSESAQRGYKVVVPVDCMSSEDPYDEQYAAWDLYKGGPAVVVDNTTLTRSDLIKFGS
jgi:nicotinamidase-related amidase